MVGLGYYDLLGPDKSRILPSTWAEVIKPGCSLTMEMWPMRNDKAEEGRSNNNLVGSPNLAYTTSYESQFETAETFNPYLNRSYPGFVESDQSVNHSEGVQSAAVFSGGSQMEGTNTETMGLGAIRILGSDVGGAHTADASSRKSHSDTTLPGDNHVKRRRSESDQPNSVHIQFEKTTSKGKQPANVRSKDKQTSASRLKNQQSKHRVSHQAEASFENESTEPTRTPSKSGISANVENPLVSVSVCCKLDSY